MTMDYKELTGSNEVVLVEFHATWCPHCRRMKPVVEQVAELLEGRAPVYQLDLDENGDVADSIKVQSVPTFLIYRNGEEVWRHSGEIDGDVLLSKVETAL